MRPVFTALFGLFSLLLAACGRDASKSHIAHDLGRTINDESAFQWHDTTDDEYFAVVEKHDSRVNRALWVSDDHEATRRLQFWANSIDAMLRARDGASFKGVPKPKVKLILNREANAFVDRAKICLKLGIAFAGSESSIAAEGIMFGRTSGYFERTYGDHPDLDCIESTFTEAQEIALVKWQFSVYPECTPEIDAAMVILPAACLGKQNNSLGNVRRAKRLIVDSTSNQITVLSHILSILTEDEMVQVLAHELGHYYMSHQTTPALNYGMYYRLGETNPGQIPKSDPDAEAMGKKVGEALRDKIYFEDYASIDNQHYHSLIYPFMRNIAYDLRAIQCAGETDCQKSCKILKDFVADDTKTKPLKNLPWKKPTEQGLSVYRDFERLAQACSTDIKLTDATNTQAFTPNVPKALSLDTVQQYLGYSSQTLANALKPLPLKDNLGQLLDHVTSRILELQEAQETRINEVLNEAMAFNLSVYTHEQEADELSAEWVDKIGINPAVGIDGIIKIGRERETDQPPAFGELSADRCAALHQNGWRDDKGNSIIVPVADWEDSHHSNCFRAFNVHREILVHRFTNFATIRRPQPTGQSWEEIVASVKSLEAAMRSSSSKM